MTVQEDVETLLARSRAKITSLWLDLSLGVIRRSELSEKMNRFLDDLERTNPEAFIRLLPEIPQLRRSVIRDQDLPSDQDDQD